MNSIIYLTRRCPRKCQYCGIRQENKQELSIDGWKTAFEIIEGLGVDFNLIHGNEPWLLGEQLLPILNSTKVPHGVYSTGYPSIFKKYRERLFSEGLNNFSCALDYPYDYVMGLSKEWDDIVKKTVDAWNALIWIREKFPKVECHASITVTKKNIKYVPQTLKEVTDLGCFADVTFVNWDIDGGLDFCASKESMKDLVFDGNNDADIDQVLDLLTAITLVDNPKLQNYDLLNNLEISELAFMKWHCKGEPCGGPTIDCDGTLRCCAYRKGTRTPHIKIFDLLSKDWIEQWQNAVKADAEDCPGCSWSCGQMYQYHKNDPEYFTIHKR